MEIKERLGSALLLLTFFLEFATSFFNCRWSFNNAALLLFLGLGYLILYSTMPQKYIEFKRQNLN
jgi:hypothetical protein